MKKQGLFLLFILILTGVKLFAQQNKRYTDSIIAYQRAYVDSHEVVKKEDKKYFRFFKPDRKFKVTATFIRTTDTVGFIMKTSGVKTPRYFKYGSLHFAIDGKECRLQVYQSQQLMSSSQYRDYLFVPYTDLTSGEESYGGGKYLEFYAKEIVDEKVIIDFNRAYNPYCAYTTGYNCPIPPRENNLPVAIKAGEKEFGKAH